MRKFRFAKFILHENKINMFCGFQIRQEKIKCIISVVKTFKIKINIIIYEIS